MAFATQRFLINNLATASNITASSQGAGTIRQAKKSGTGTATLNPSGSYTGSGNKTITVQCDLAGTVGSGATYRWKTSDTAAGSWEATGQSATTTITALGSEGINITFSSGTLVLYDSFVFPVYAEYGPANLFMNDRDFFYKSGALTDLVTDGDGEATTGWTATDCTLASVAGGETGNCLQITRTGGSAQIADQDITTVVGERYTLTAYVKSGTSGDEAFTIGVNGIGTTAGTSSSTWTKYTYRFTATATTSTIELIKNTATAGTMLFDTIVMTAQVSLEIDLGAATNITVSALLDHNFSSAAIVRLCMNASDAWTSPSYESAILNGDNDDPEVNYIDQTYRYIKCFIDDPDNSDGFISLGKLYAGTYSELSGNLKNIPWGSSKAESLFRVRNRSDWGKQSGHVSAKTVRFATQYFPTRTSGDLTVLQNVFAATYDLDMGQDKAILLHYSYDEERTLYLVLCMSNDFDEQYPNYAHYGITLIWEGEVLTRSI